MKKTLLVLAAAAICASAAVTGAGPVGVSFSPNVRVNKAVHDAAGEPSTVVDGKGRIHVAWHTQTQASPLDGTGSFCARSVDGGKSFSAPVVCDVSGSSNGDPWLAADPKNADHIYFGTLNLLASAGNFSESFDGGQTWTTRRIAVNGGVDREWITVAKDGTVYYSYHDIGPEFLYVMKSTDSGQTWQPGGLPAGIGYPVNTNTEDWPDLVPNTNQGPPVIDPTNQDRILYPFLTATLEQNTIENQNLPAPWGDLSNVNAAISEDGGETWRNLRIFTGPEHSNAAYALPSAAIDDAGIMYLAFADNLPTESNRWHIYIMRSFDHGATWDTKPIRVDAKLKNAAMPHIVAGSKGRIGLAFYGSATDVNPTNDDRANWDVWYMYSLDADKPAPTFTPVKVTSKVNHKGRICPLGLACTNGRDLHDLFDLRLDQAGGVNIPWTSTTGGDGPGKSAVYFSCQDAGPSLFAGKGTITGCNKATGVLGARTTRTDPGIKPGGAKTPLASTGVEDHVMLASVLGLVALALVRRLRSAR